MSETDEQARLFPPTIPPPAEGIFELGLVLGGTVSAGAYTAGALDLLIEALESWHDGTEKHKVLLKFAGGSSGGAVCASTLGVLSGKALAHARDAAFADAEKNPLWNLWVETFDFEKMLSTGDLDPPRDADAGSGAPSAAVQHVPSLLNCTVIDDGAAGIVHYAETAPPEPRTYFASPFRVAVTVANIRGIPFQMEVPTLAGFTGAAFMQHDDHAWFAFPNGADVAEKRPDEFWLQNGAGGFADSVGYDVLGAYAVSSGAMPLGLAARSLNRPRAHYTWRPSVVARENGFDVHWPEPNWAQLPEAGDAYRFTAVDGGTLNNDPVRLVHRALTGLVGCNDRAPEAARRAMLMIDPLADRPPAVPLTGTSLIAVAGGIVPTFVQGARYLTADMDLFGDKNVFSRFQLVPNRPDPQDSSRILVGEPALAGTSLAALAGFADRRLRIHDYLLGRHNMRDYLDHFMVLRADNPLFNGWTDDTRKDHACDNQGHRIEDTAVLASHDRYYLPILPVPPELQAGLPDWPAGALDPGRFEDDIRKRTQAVLDRAIDDNLHGPLNWLVTGIAVPAIAGYVARAAVDGWKQALQNTGLMAQEV